MQRVPGSPDRVVQIELASLRPTGGLDGFRIPELCVVSSDAQLFCGSRAGVQRVPLRAPRGVGVTAVAIGNDAMCRLRTDNVVECAGDNSIGQLGAPARVASSRRFRRVPIPPAVELAAGFNFTCARTSEGVFCWGRLGCEPRSSPACEFLDGLPPPPHPFSARRPVRIPNTAGSVALTARADQACVVQSSGEVACWGCGLGSHPTELVPLP